jgi:hypothetical protein
LADDVIGELRAAGFRLQGVASPTAAADGRPLQADMVFGRG